jgi:hypothetical protein
MLYAESLVLLMFPQFKQLLTYLKFIFNFNVVEDFLKITTGKLRSKIFY